MIFLLDYVYERTATSTIAHQFPDDDETGVKIWPIDGKPGQGQEDRTAGARDASASWVPGMHFNFIVVFQVPTTWWHGMATTKDNNDEGH
jgi:hypothetical protein